MKKTSGEFSFDISNENEIALHALTNYMQMIDKVAKANGAIESLNVDGLINYLLEDAIKRKISEIVKRHGFEDKLDFINALSLCRKVEDVELECMRREQNRLISEHALILEQIPFQDNQRSLPFDLQET